MTGRRSAVALLALVFVFASASVSDALECRIELSRADAAVGEPFTVSNESASTELVVKDYDGADIVTIDPDTVVQLAPGRNGEWVVTRVAARIYP